MYFMMSLGCLLFSSVAEAEEAVVAAPGIMCGSADALAVLTLHGGNSRTHREKPEATDLELARRGGCQDLQIGERLSVLKRFRNTAIVVPASGSWPAISDRFVAPLIDLRLLPTEGEQLPATAEAPADVVPGKSARSWFIANSDGGCTVSFSPRIEAKMLHDNGFDVHVRNVYDERNVPVETIVSHDASGTSYAYVFYANMQRCLADGANGARREAAGR